MGKTGKWLRNFLTGKKDKQKEKCPSDQNSSTTPEYPVTPISFRQDPKGKKRWSFQRLSAAAAVSRDSCPLEMIGTTMPQAKAAMGVDYEEKRQTLAMAIAKAATAAMDIECEQKRCGWAMVVAKAAPADATVAASRAAAIKIQSVFRSYLARKALRVLRGLVKLQALVRGHLVRKQAKATLRRMQALITAQARARAQRIRMIEGTIPSVNKDHFGYTDLLAEENIKIVEMDHGEYKRASKNRTTYVADQQHEHRYTHQACHVSQVPSNLIDIDTQGGSSHFEDYSICTVQKSPQDFSAKSKTPIVFPTPDCMQSLSFEYPMFPGYMANTKSSIAKARSQSAPKTRPESFERQSSRQRASTEGKNIPKTAQMQRSSSLVGCAAHDYQYPLLMKLDKSTCSLHNSECGSTSTVLTYTNYVA